MKLSTLHPRPLALAVLASLTLSACVIAPRYPMAYGNYPVVSQSGYPPDTVVVGVAPPPVQVEVIPVLPYVGALWVSGFWRWGGGRHHWAPGHYVRPVPGHRFVPHHWSHSGGGRWAQRGGHWVR